MIPLRQGFQFPSSLQQAIDMWGSQLVSVVTKIVILVVTFVVIYLIGRFILVRGTRRALEARGFEETVTGLAARVARIAALLVALVVGLTFAGFGRFLSAFAVVISALSLALGFAAQDLISNFVAGIFILRDKPFETGDWIEWNDKQGVVQEIRLRVTKLETFDNELITVPNSELANNAVTNPVANGQLRIPFLFGIGYEDDIDEAKEILIQEAATTEGILAEPEPSIILTELGGSSVGLTARVWIEDADRATYVNVLSDYVQAVKERYDAEGIDMPYPTTELTGGIDIDNLAEAEQTPADD